MSMSDDEYEFFDDDAVEEDDQEHDSGGQEEEDNYMADSDDDCSDDVVEFCILSSKDIRARVDKDVLQISSLLSVAREAAVVLLCRYGWDVTKIHEEWFSDEEKTRKACGLVVSEDSGSKRKGKGKFFCGICLENYNRNAVGHCAVVASCGHVFCEECWRTYIRMAIQGGPSCVFMRCPQPSCGASIVDMIGSLASDEDRVKYENQVLRSYVEERKNMKWCPSPGCDFCVECLGGDSSGGYINFDVTCNCSYGFCWNCSEEAHSPTDCATVAKWNQKNTAEAENTNWILAHTKACPKCQKWIEKNQGCMHMRCRPPCDFEFCWLCLGAWSEHGTKTGGYFSCNRYNEEKGSDKYNEAEKVREMAKHSLERYTHYYERWLGNHNSRRKALEDMKKLPTEHFVSLGVIHTDFYLKFITDAWVQIVECRRVLKWTYALGYYLPEVEPAKKRLFEYLQGEAEFGLERLHECAEEELSKHSKGEVPQIEFHSFCTKLQDLTKITRNYFDNLVRALANGLSDVN